MKLLRTLVTVAPASLAAIVRHQTDQDAQEVHVVLQLHKASSESSVAVQNADRSKILQYGCGTSLNSVAFEEYPISFVVNDNGAGNLSIGSASYLIHEDPELSGGISCGRLHSSTETLVTCAITLPASMRLKPLDQYNLTECFRTSGTFHLASILAALENGTSDQPTLGNLAAPPLQGHPSGLDKRQGPCSIWTPGTWMVGDGDPHQNPFNIQLSVGSDKPSFALYLPFCGETNNPHPENMECDAQRPCSIPHGAAKSFTIGFRASASLTEWISGGFAVQQSVETGNSYECSGNPADFFCLWKKVDQTAYSVQNVLYNACTGNSPSGSPFLLWSPNSNGVGSWFYCVYGRQYCRSPGQGWLDTTGRAGGP